MPGEFDFFDDEPKAAPKPKPAPRPVPPPKVEPESEIEFDPIDEDDPPLAAPVARRPRVEEVEDRPRYRGREPADPRKKPSALLVAGIIIGSLLVLGGATAGIMIAVSGKSKPTEPKDKPVAATPRTAKTTTPAPPVDPDRPSPDVVDRVKKATVYVRCAFKNGEGGTGSGFVVKDSGLVVTNAHVVGLKEEKFKGPKAIELVFNSGEGPEKEYHYGGELVAYDREQDLAILRPFILEVGARQAVPDGIPVSKAPNLSLLQKLFVFGFPLGESIGKEITVSETSITSLRKDPETGKLKLIQVKGGITHGNSGGPLVDIHGNVVGVAVAEYTGTDIRLAIPSEVVQEFIAKHKK